MKSNNAKQHAQHQLGLALAAGYGVSEGQKDRRERRAAERRAAKERARRESAAAEYRRQHGGLQ